MVRSVDTVVVVTVPGLGDDIQAIKAGILEIADVFVVNKADREGVERAVRDLQMMLSLGEHGDWVPPMLQTVARREEGIPEVLAAVEQHREWLDRERRARGAPASHLRLRVETILKERVLAAADRVLGVDREVERGFAARSTTPTRWPTGCSTGVLEHGTIASAVLEHGTVASETATAAGVAGQDKR